MLSQMQNRTGLKRASQGLLVKERVAAAEAEDAVDMEQGSCPGKAQGSGNRGKGIKVLGLGVRTF